MSQIIAVAHTGVNKDGRSYDSATLNLMANAALGEKVFDHWQRTTELEHLVGVVVWSSFHDDTLFVQVRWFEAKTPVGMFVTPCGMGKLGAGGMITGYVLTCFALSNESSFENATKVT